MHLDYINRSVIVVSRKDPEVLRVFLSFLLCLQNTPFSEFCKLEYRMLHVRIL